MSKPARCVGCVQFSGVRYRDDQGWAGWVRSFVWFGLDVDQCGRQLVDVYPPLLGADGVDAFGDVGLNFVQAW